MGEIYFSTIAALTCWKEHSNAFGFLITRSMASLLPNYTTTGFLKPDTAPRLRILLVQSSTVRPSLEEVSSSATWHMVAMTLWGNASYLCDPAFDPRDIDWGEYEKTLSRRTAWSASITRKSCSWHRFTCFGNTTTIRSMGTS